MKLIIAGCRHFDEDLVYAKLVELRSRNHPMVEADEIVSGCASGVDTAGEGYAEFYGDIPVAKFPARWHDYGTKAGPIRNKQMAEYADALLLIWNGKSKGSANMKMNMEKLGKPVYEVVVDDADMRFDNNNQFDTSLDDV